MQKSKSSRFILVLASLLVMLALMTACSGEPTAAAPSSSGEKPVPSNPGGTGEAVNLVGDAGKGAEIYMANCQSCHGEEGKGGVANPGSADGTVPALNPVDAGLKGANAKEFAANLDLFLEHGSTPEGDAPTLSMLKFGDENLLSAQEIADVIAYVISLNP